MYTFISTVQEKKTSQQLFMEKVNYFSVATSYTDYIYVLKFYF